MRASTRKKRELLSETALRLFIERGYEQVSVDEIIAATGTSKGTFYHYFRSKEDLLGEAYGRLFVIIDQWSSRTPSQVDSLEGHINRLFLDLADAIEPYPRLFRSLSAAALQQETIGRRASEWQDRLAEALLRWMPDPAKTGLLSSVFHGTLLEWCKRDDLELKELLKSRLALAWNGLRAGGHAAELRLAPQLKEENIMRIGIIGGGLAGLTAAAYLSEQAGIEGVLFERSPQLGGRAFTYEKAGFTLNYGAHAIYGIDRHKLTVMERELGLSFSSKQVDKRRVMYEKYDQITPAPLDFINIVKTDLLSTMQKVRFVGEVAKIIAHIHELKNYETLGDYLAASDADEDVKELWEHLVCSNFFIAPEDARKVSGAVISEYYQNLFLSSRPVNYILGSWAVITNQLRAKIEASGRWSLALQEGVDGIRYEGGKYVLTTKKREEAFDRVIFAMPVQQVVKLLKGTAWEPFLAPYERNTPTEVMVYDVGLKHVVARPFSYISDMNNKMFISDVSATDHTLVPEGGQLLQGIAYLTDDFETEEERKAYLEERTAKMEELFDRHYPGWREAIEVKRVSKKAMVSSVKNIVTNRLLPVKLDSVPFWFCGDGCQGKGELAERAFSTARTVAQSIIAELKTPVAAR
ncbi:FAD-dependent oxidoreductase [Paenibacillus thermoaerophilus]|uniref:FAD-dependent oxidoreductase n=1 Tax=Paenibacillus thermoaerophilus TaxID=1215385 RepID=A0ABW2UXG2_9BACL|nr:FAD-dependent oxidoreductase [Paenibacillus thermoaerophilus]TMV19209.1 TetR family transcriptional regulator [Paenibacillus thermoaerophilus]